MKKVIQTLCLLMVTAILITSCQTSSENPTTVLKSFFERLSKEDIEGATKLASKDSKSTMDMLKKGLDMAKNMDSLTKEDPMKEFKDAEFSDAKIDGNTATVTVSSKTNKQPSADFTLVKEDGAWKVDFTMATLMKMGAKNLPAHTGDVQDSGAIPTPENLEQAQKTADSIMKNMDPKQLQQLQEQLQKLK